jgi:hypothetical protein
MQPSLDRKTASGFAKLALRNVRKEYPHTGNALNDPSDIKNPAAVHPAFYGCFDWHSCVHTHWMLAHILKIFPDLEDADEIRNALQQDLSTEKIEKEEEYLRKHPSFERTYGWAWLLKLYDEVSEAEEKEWQENLKPLADGIERLYMEFLPKQKYPIRCGVHPNTAFGIAFALDHARAERNRKLEELLMERSRTYFRADADCPVLWEPGGNEFLSPSLMEATLMQRILQKEEFSVWLQGFMPELGKKEIFKPATVSDRSDPYLVHLDGLNLSRAWCMLEMLGALPEDDKRRAALQRSAKAHAEASLPHVMSGHYGGEHWLATFAVYLLSL